MIREDKGTSLLSFIAVSHWAWEVGTYATQKSVNNSKSQYCLRTERKRVYLLMAPSNSLVRPSSNPLAANSQPVVAAALAAPSAEDAPSVVL